MTRSSERARPDREGPVVRTGVLFFSTPGCTACRTVRSKIAELGAPGEVPIVEIDAGSDTGSVARHRILAAPTLLALHDGVEVARHTGVVSAEVLDELRASAVAGKGFVRSTIPSGLVVLRLFAAAILILVGVVTATPTLIVFGAVIAIWALAPLARKLHELRTR